MLLKKKEFALTPEEAYGLHDENQIRAFTRSELPAGMEPKVDGNVAFPTPEGQQIPDRLIKMDGEKLTFDLNHPLVGESFTFAIEVVGISDTPPRNPKVAGPTVTAVRGVAADITFWGLEPHSDRLQWP